MTETLTRIDQRDAEASRAPHLSYSRIQKYLTCPEQYRLYYIEGLRSKVESASLAFGSIVHLALADFFRHGTDPATTFRQHWEAMRTVELRFPRKESWDGLRVKGEKLLHAFLSEHRQKLGNVTYVEKAFRLGLSNLDVPFVGTIDLVAEMDGKRTIVEFKTAAADYEDYEVTLLDQLTAYYLVEPEAEQASVCVFVKTQKPKIEWHTARRTPEQVVEYVEKLELVADQIDQRNFYKRPGKWCRQCDFLPVCLGNRKRAQETLVRIA